MDQLLLVEEDDVAPLDLSLDFLNDDLRISNIACAAWSGVDDVAPRACNAAEQTNGIQDCQSHVALPGADTASVNVQAEAPATAEEEHQSPNEDSAVESKALAYAADAREQDFVLGEMVRCRDDSKGHWVFGNVLHRDPLTVQPLGTAEALRWRKVEKLQAQDALKARVASSMLQSVGEFFNLWAQCLLDASEDGRLIAVMSSADKVPDIELARAPAKAEEEFLPPKKDSRSESDPQVNSADTEAEANMAPAIELARNASKVEELPPMQEDTPFQAQSAYAEAQFEPPQADAIPTTELARTPTTAEEEPLAPKEDAPVESDSHANSVDAEAQSESPKGEFLVPAAPVHQDECLEPADFSQARQAELPLGEWKSIHDRLGEKIMATSTLWESERGTDAVPESAARNGCNLHSTSGPESGDTMARKHSLTSLDGTQFSVASVDTRINPDWIRERWSQLRTTDNSRPSSRSSNDPPPHKDLIDLTSHAAFLQKMEALAQGPPAPAPSNHAVSSSELPEGPPKELPPAPDFAPPVFAGATAPRNLI
jgi:hypothetical protein